MDIKPWNEQQSAAVQEIYQHGIDTGNATFETSVPYWKIIDEKFLPHSRVGAFEGEKLIGWAALSPVSNRECYKGVAEVTIYVHKDFQGQGVGKALLKELISQSEQNGIWSLLVLSMKRTEQAFIYTSNVVSGL